MVKLTAEEKRTRRNAYMRGWKKRNPKLVNAQNQRWKNKHRDQVRAAGRKYMEQIRSTEEGRQRTNAAVRRYAKHNPEKVAAATQAWFDAHPNYNREYIMKRAKADPRTYLYRQARRRARLRGVEFSISVNDIVIPEVCPVLGTPLKVGSGKRGRANYSPSVDRFDNSKGYIPGNVRVISMRANWLKSDATVDEIERVIAYMRGK